MSSELQEAWIQSLSARALGPIAKNFRLIVREQLGRDGRVVVDFDASNLEKLDFDKVARSRQRVAAKVQDLLDRFLEEHGLCEEDQKPLRSVIIKLLQSKFMLLDY